MKLDDITDDLSNSGFVFRGIFHPGPEDQVPDLSSGQSTLSVIMVGNIGSGDFWDSFKRSDEFLDAVSDPMDNWTKRTVGPIAAKAGGEALFPSDGPPYHPFQKWASRAEALFSSPIGLFISSDWGTWHALRAAILLPEAIELPAPKSEVSSPCLSCEDQPCLKICPVDAFGEEHGYDYLACADHVASKAGTSCATKGCLARRACPVGQQHTLRSEHATFHMSAFINERKRMGEI
ncbi:hypothetical protein WH96_19965 [Kiloniella spongiae]|uniref:4Fe-4S ferredoxin-type domain-containing protein n=1 Tax=Kiloniella spongiae TaxID=1489064 RepID=A0A0H2MA26_9PROT|nr:hypothetical protein WH96_19965 [Kiloniella spongiae]